MKRATPLDPDAPTVGRQNGATAPVDALATPAPEYQLRAVGVPLDFHVATFDRSKDTAALRHARSYLVDRGFELGYLLGLTGPTGVGKSWADAAIVNAVLVAHTAAGRDLFEHDWQPAWFSCAALVREARSFKTEHDVMARVRRAKLLVIDEVRIPDATALSVLDEVLGLRHAERLATVFTSNMTADELAGALSDRLLDRLRTWGVIHDVGGPSLRKDFAP